MAVAAQQATLDFRFSHMSRPGPCTGCAEIFSYDPEEHVYYLSRCGAPATWEPALNVAEFIAKVVRFHWFAWNYVDAELQPYVDRTLQPGTDVASHHQLCAVEAELYRNGTKQAVPSDCDQDAGLRQHARDEFSKLLPALKRCAEDAFASPDPPELGLLHGCLVDAQPELCWRLGEDVATRELFGLLVPTTRLAASVLDAHLRVLFPQPSPNPNVFVCQSATVLRMLAKAHDKGSCVVPVVLADGFTVICPCHHPGHWTLLLATIQVTPNARAGFRLHVQVFDSMGTVERPEHLTLAKTLLRQFMRLDSEKRGITWSLHCVLGGIVQRNVYDCGIYVLWWLRVMAVHARESDGDAATLADKLVPPERAAHAIGLMRYIVVTEIALGEMVSVPSDMFLPQLAMQWQSVPNLPAFEAETVKGRKRTTPQPQGQKWRRTEEPAPIFTEGMLRPRAIACVLSIYICIYNHKHILVICGCLIENIMCA